MKTYRHSFCTSAGFVVTMHGKHIDPLEGVPDHWPQSNEREYLVLRFSAPSADVRAETVHVTFFSKVAVHAFIKALPSVHLARGSTELKGDDNRLPGSITLTPGGDATYMIFTVVEEGEDSKLVSSVGINYDTMNLLISALGQAAQLFSE